MDDFSLGRRLFEAREKLGLNQTQLSKELRARGLVKIHASTLSRIEQGERAIKLSELPMLAEVLGVPMQHFLPDPEPLGSALAKERRSASDWEHKAHAATAEWEEARSRLAGVQLLSHLSMDGNHACRVNWAIDRFTQTVAGLYAATGLHERSLLAVLGVEQEEIDQAGDKIDSALTQWNNTRKFTAQPGMHLPASLLDSPELAEVYMWRQAFVELFAAHFPNVRFADPGTDDEERVMIVTTR